MIIEYSKILQSIDDFTKNSESEKLGLLRKIFSNLYINNDEKRTAEELIAIYLCQQTYNYVELDKIQGCLVGGAIGDALGFPVEFLEDYQIFSEYGETGITEYTLYNGKAYISDDTQMTLFTAEGLLKATQKFEKPTLDQYVKSIYESYLDWLFTQQNEGSTSSKTDSELLKIKDLYNRRAPGNACLSSLSSGSCGTFTYKLNNSKGCGGIMRVAPIALYLAQQPEYKNLLGIGELGARASAITHGHELGYIPSAFLSVFIACLVRGDFPQKALDRAKSATKTLFSNSKNVDICLDLVDKAINLACPDDEKDLIDDLEAIRYLGEGWVAEETLAIALYCCFKYIDQEDAFKKAIIASINHSGDSDSTGAVTGNIMGAILGLKRIPKAFIDNLELKETILNISKKLQIHKLDKFDLS